MMPLSEKELLERDAKRAAREKSGPDTVLHCGLLNYRPSILNLMRSRGRLLEY